MDGGDEREILRCLESSDRRKEAFIFLANTGILNRP